MGKRGRKPNPDKRPGYFYEEEEKAFVEYINAKTKEEKEKIFKEKLHRPFTKMIQSIIRRYKLYTPNETFDTIFDDTFSFLMIKMNYFDPNAGKKAYSYCGTICKNYLIKQINDFDKYQKRNASYEDNSVALDDKIELSYSENNDKNFISELIENVKIEIKNILDNKEKNNLNENEIKIGNALINILENWEDLFLQMGSDKFNKSSIYMFIKETTLLEMKEVRDGMKKYKNIYNSIKNKMLKQY